MGISVLLGGVPVLRGLGLVGVLVFPGGLVGRLGLYGIEERLVSGSVEDTLQAAQFAFLRCQGRHWVFLRRGGRSRMWVSASAGGIPDSVAKARIRWWSWSLTRSILAMNPCPLLAFESA